MNSTQALTLLDEIAADASVLHKQAKLRDNIGDDFFKTVCKMTYDPFITFGVGPVTIAEMRKIAPGDQVWNESTLDMLQALRQRELTGYEAQGAIRLQLQVLDADSGELLLRVLDKDLRAGFGDTLLNKVCPGLIPEFPYMRCTLTDKINLDEWLAEDGAAIVQEKADGMFTNVNKDRLGYVWLTTRQGTPIPRAPLEQVYQAVEKWLRLDTQSHGELVVIDPAGKVLPREEGNGMLNSVLKGGDLEEGHRVMLLLWDQIPLDAVVPKGVYRTHYEKRLLALVGQMPNINTGAPLQLIPTEVVRTKKAIYSHFARMLAAGKEGSIVSKLTGIWKDSDSAKEKAKLKLEVVVDLRVKSFLPGKGKNAKTFGSLLCETDDGQLEVGVSGFKDKERADLWARKDEVLGTIASVTANEVMYPSKPGEKHSLFLPRIEGFRADKVTADSLGDVIRQFNVAKGLEEAVPA